MQNLVAQGGQKRQIAAKVQQLQQMGDYQEALKVVDGNKKTFVFANK